MPSLQANGLDIAYEEMGEPSDPLILLVMGLSAQMHWWDDDFCTGLAAKGYRVVRFDNRDVGGSTKITGGPPVDLGGLLVGDRSAVPYSLEDMAADTVGLLDGLGVGAAHVVGASMGGMIAQALAIAHPERVLSLCSIMSTTGATDVGQPSEEAVAVLLRPPATDWESYLDGALVSARVIGSPGFPFDEERIRSRAERSWAGGYYPDGVVRQLAAILAAADRTGGLGRLEMPTLVVHGESDPLVNPSGGRATAAAVPGAELLTVPGMGHDLPSPVWPMLIDAIVANAERSGG
ncbi:MAG: alpha/beta fold hydrolase [Acidimicrobiales bacterium]